MDCVAQSTGLMATAWARMTISFDEGLWYGAVSTFRAVAFSEVSQAAVLNGAIVRGGWWYWDFDGGKNLTQIVRK